MATAKKIKTLPEITLSLSAEEAVVLKDLLSLVRAPDGLDNDQRVLTVAEAVWNALDDANVVTVCGDLFTTSDDDDNIIYGNHGSDDMLSNALKTWMEES